jgi:hypothetical protein
MPRGLPRGNLTLSLFLTLSPVCLPDDLQGDTREHESPASDPVHVYVLCENHWENGRVINQADVDVRDGTSFGPAISDAAVSVNEHDLSFDQDTRTYRGIIGDIEQWQRIPILIRSRDKRVIRGHIVVVFMVKIVQPAPWSSIPPSLQLPVKWEYSEGSMHTVDLVVKKNAEDLRSYEISGNSTTINFKKLGTNFQRSDVIRIQIKPFWTSNYEFEGYTTKRSKAEFVTTAVLSVKFSQDRR